VRVTELEKALEPFEGRLRAQERLRRRLGVKDVDRPTYGRYITGPIDRFDSQRNAFATLRPDNPYGAEFREAHLRRRRVATFSQMLPYSQVEVEERPAQALTEAVWRLCRHYHPEPLPQTPAEGRFAFDGPDAAERMARLIKKVGMFLGADMVKIARVDQRWVYADREVSHEYAIVCVVAHHSHMTRTAPSHVAGVAVADTYTRLKFMTTQLTDFIRQLGYDAMYRETLGKDPDLLMVPVAIDAGVGEFARTGRVLSPEFGINMRLKAVTTDLPLAVDKPISFGTHDFCMACENCAKHCPPRAVPFGEPAEVPEDAVFHNPGFRKWYIRADRCLLFWSANRQKWLTCGGRCIAACPWNQPRNGFHNLVRFLAIHSPASVKKALVWADDKLYPPRDMHEHFED
jgi:reductive dehalogenase